MGIENTKIPVEESNDLHDFSSIIPDGVEATEEMKGMIQKMEGLVTHTEENILNTEEGNTENILGLASDRLGINISGMDSKMKQDFIASLESGINVG